VSEAARKARRTRAAAEPVTPDPAVAAAPRTSWQRLVARTQDLGSFVDPILKTLLLIGVIVGGYEYFSRQQSVRVEKSLALVDEWETGGHRQAYQRINDLIWPLYLESAEAIRALGDDAAQRALIYGNLGETVTGRDDDFSSAADRDVDQVFYFFERAGLCANERICDYDVIDTFLGEEARTFWLYFARYAERRQALGYARYGAWTERLAEGEVKRAWFGVI
jgi:hypothetical protein